MNLSTSYSSDDTHPAGNRDSGHQRVDSSSSSDSSDDAGGQLSEAVDGQRGEGSGSGSHGNREENGNTEGGPANTRRSIAKPDDSTIELPVSSPSDIIHNKNAKSSNKMQNVRGNEGNDPPIITEELPPCSGTVQSADPENGERTLQPSSVCRLEMSPVIAAPSVLSLSSPQGHFVSEQADGGAPHTDVSNGASSGSCSNLAPGPQAFGRGLSSADASSAFENEASLSRQQRYSRPSPSKNIPPHIRKAKNGSSHGMMKHLSRSMDDIDRHTERGEAGPRLSCMPPKQFSQSVHNIHDAPPERRGQDGNHAAPLQRGFHHHQSQPLELSESPWRRDFHQEDIRQGRPESDPHHEGGRQERAKSDQPPGERRHSRGRSDQHTSERCSEPQERGPKPQTLPRERNSSHPGDRTSKPDPRPRQVYPAGERGNDPEGRPSRPNPRPRQSHTPGGSRNDPEGRPSRLDLRPVQTHAPGGKLNDPEGRPARPDPRPRQARPPGPEERGGRCPEQPRSPQRCDPGHAYGAQYSVRDQPPPPYSHSLDRHRVDSAPHSQRNALSLERSGQHAGRECQAGGGARERQDLLDSDNRNRRGPLPTKPDRPSLLPKPDGKAGPHPSRRQGHQSPSGGQATHHPNRTSGPPPYRPSDSNRAHRPSDLNIPSCPQNQSRNQRAGPPDQIRGAPDALNQKKNTGDPKPDHPPKPARTSRPPSSSGSVPKMGVHSAARPERSPEERGCRDGHQGNSLGSGSPAAGSTNSPHCLMPKSAPNNTIASPHSPTPTCWLNNASSFPHSSVPNSAVNNHFSAPRSPTASTGLQNPTLELPQNPVDSLHSAGSPVYPQNEGTNFSAGGQLDSPNSAGGLNVNANWAPRATAVVPAFSAAQMFPSPGSTDVIPATILSLRMGEADEEEDIYV